MAIISNTKRILAGIALTLVCASVNATPIVDSLGNITNLTVLGTDYDVAWNFGSSSPGSGDFALFTGNETLAKSFMDAVLAAFNGAGFTGVSGQTYYGVDWALNTGAILLDSGSSFSRANGGHGPWGNYSDAGWGAGMVTQSVPEPVSLTLLLLGLLGLRIRRNRQI